jgi:hypothetical protein
MLVEPKAVDLATDMAFSVPKMPSWRIGGRLSGPKSPAPLSRWAVAGPKGYDPRSGCGLSGPKIELSNRDADRVFGGRGLVGARFVVEEDVDE